ncbi:hypothetical protein MPSEU_000667200 [Mayamaea pseudoterrestris]|nr:hypothetical protein MPSEU_000667200 [Mayamaea pseudoterrestris]
MKFQMSDCDSSSNTDDKDVGHVYRGTSAELAVVRAAAGNFDALRVAIEQYMDHDKQEVLLHDAISVKVQLVTDYDDEKNEEQEDALAAFEGFVHGTLVLTSERVMFWACDASQEAHDFAMDAACIELHALQEEPEMAVYIQAQDNDANDDAAPLEVTIVPIDSNSSSSESSDACQEIFDALCKLVSMHPIDPNENDEGNAFEMMLGAFNQGNNDDNMMFYSAEATTDMMEGDATLDERERMLQRLDDLLVVPPELERNSDDDGGQFSDADDSENLL